MWAKAENHCSNLLLPTTATLWLIGSLHFFQLIRHFLAWSQSSPSLDFMVKSYTHILKAIVPLYFCHIHFTDCWLGQTKLCSFHFILVPQKLLSISFIYFHLYRSGLRRANNSTYTFQLTLQELHSINGDPLPTFLLSLLGL